MTDLNQVRQLNDLLREDFFHQILTLKANNAYIMLMQAYKSLTYQINRRVVPSAWL